MDREKKFERVFVLAHRICSELEARIPPEAVTVAELKSLVEQLRGNPKSETKN